MLPHEENGTLINESETIQLMDNRRKKRPERSNANKRNKQLSSRRASENQSTGAGWLARISNNFAKIYLIFEVGSFSGFLTFHFGDKPGIQKLIYGVTVAAVFIAMGVELFNTRQCRQALIRAKRATGLRVSKRVYRSQAFLGFYLFSALTVILLVAYSVLTFGSSLPHQGLLCHI